MTKIDIMMVGKVFDTVDRKITHNYQWGPGHTADVVRYHNKLYLVHNRNGRRYIKIGL